MNIRDRIKDKKRVVIKIGSSSLTHAKTGRLDLIKMEVLVREISDMLNRGIEVVLVSSGAIAVGRKAMGIDRKPDKVSEKQACAAVGQARLMMIYQKLFAEYNHTAAQVLMTRDTMINDMSRRNARNTFNELLKMGAIPIVNENDTISTYEIEFGDNDTLSSVVAALIDADLLILLSDIDGLYSDDPRVNPDAQFIDIVEQLDDRFVQMGKGTTGSSVGTGGMATKINAAQIATSAGADMVIANGADFHILHRIMDGRQIGTLFIGNRVEEFHLIDFLKNM